MTEPGDITTLIGRLASFEHAQQIPKRRSSSTRKKAAAASTVTWPHSSPAPEELAHAGFFWKPLPNSPDNVRCFHCEANIDGWESTDNPADEHLALSPNCAWAIIQSIRMRIDNADRMEDDPMSEEMVEARIATFGDRWPYEKKKGWKPKTKKLAQAGWFYDPSPTDPDGTSCAYCSLSLDGWEQKDDPMEEHQRRSSDCLFFALTQQKKPKARASKAKKTRASTRASSTRASSRPAPSVSSTVRQSIGTKRTRNGSFKESSPAPELESPVASPVAMETSPPVELESPMPEQPSSIIVPSSPVVRQSSPMQEESPLPREESSAPQEESPVPMSAPAEPSSPSASDETPQPPWQPIDLEKVLRLEPVMSRFGTSTDDVGEAISQAEMEMTVHEWIHHNASVAEKAFFEQTEKQIQEFEAQGFKALRALESVATH